ncbi:MAG: heavy metal-binding domain-containing protein [Candidatus Bathyarchaeota archaeon]|nr:MAG: heavy metal-binding domain-containing protein [Candidatus Bathyarchaeota archaeon]
MGEISCPKCGKKSPEQASFCPSCGSPLTKPKSPEMIVVTTPTVPGYEIVKVLGTVHGLTVRTRGVGGKIVAAVEGVFGGEVTSYSYEAEKARNESLQRLTEEARKLGASAIVGADFETSDILQGTATLFSAYGTAVIVRPIKQ